MTYHLSLITSLLKDNAAKAVGLAQFAEKHWNLFDRIQLIRKKKGSDGVKRYFRLDVGNDTVRKKVLAVTTNSQLDQVFDDQARPRWKITIIGALLKREGM